MNWDSRSILSDHHRPLGGAAAPTAPPIARGDLGARLTGLAQLEERLASGRHGDAFTLFYVTLQGFVLVNGRYDPHVAGVVCAEMSRRLLAWLGHREGAVAPVGADHFLLVCAGRWDDASTDQAVRELRDSLTRPVRDGSLAICFSVSIAVATRDPNGLANACSGPRDQTPLP